MPTTLSSGIALTGQARGNVALALLLTVLTNVGGIFTVPFALALLLNPVLQTVGPVELSAADLLVKLCLSILLPLAVGNPAPLFRSLDNGSAFAFELGCNVALISVPWMKFSQSSERLAQVAPLELLLLVAGGLAIHLLYLALNMSAVKLLPVGLAEGKAVVLLASQKTLPVAMTVLAFLPVPRRNERSDRHSLYHLSLWSDFLGCVPRNALGQSRRRLEKAGTNPADARLAGSI